MTYPTTRVSQGGVVVLRCRPVTGFPCLLGVWQVYRFERGWIHEQASLGAVFAGPLILASRARRSGMGDVTALRCICKNDGKWRKSAYFYDLFACFCLLFGIGSLFGLGRRFFMRDFWVIIVVRAVKPRKRLHSRNIAENELMNTYARGHKSTHRCSEYQFYVYK